MSKPGGGSKPTSTDTPGANLLAIGKSWLGVPYRFGGDSRSGIDCSALMQEIAHAAGKNIPRTSQEQYAALIPITQSQLLPGDLVFSAGSDGTTSHPGHVGMYAGGGQVLNAPHTGTVVRLESLSGWGAVGYRRIPGINGAPADASIDLSAAGNLAAAAGGHNSDNGGGLLDWPGEITSFFTTASSDLTSMTSWFAAFGQVSTWIRIGAGVLGLPLLIVGLVLLVRAASRAGAAGGAA